MRQALVLAELVARPGAESRGVARSHVLGAGSIRGACLLVLAGALVEPAPRHDRGVVERGVEHLTKLLQLERHPRRILHVVHRDVGPQGLLPHDDPRLVHPVQPPLVLRVVGTAHEVGASILEQRQVRIQLCIGGCAAGVWPLRVVVPAVQLDHMAIEPLHDAADPRALDRERVQLRVGCRPTTRLRHLEPRQSERAGLRNRRHVGRGAIVEREGAVVHATEVLVGEHHSHIYRAEVGPRQDVRAPHRDGVGQLTTVVPEVAARVQRRRILVEAVVGEHGERACRVVAGRQVEEEGNIATGAVLADLFAVDPHAAVEGAGAKPQPGMLGALLEGGAVDGRGTGAQVAWRLGVNARGHRRRIGRPGRRGEIELRAGGHHAVVQPVRPLAVEQRRAVRVDQRSVAQQQQVLVRRRRWRQGTWGASGEPRSVAEGEGLDPRPRRRLAAATRRAAMGWACQGAPPPSHLDARVPIRQLLTSLVCD
eukprot:scaffold90946_cov61-Phaeocystis_antarctica.AAC.5